MIYNKQKNSETKKNENIMWFEENKQQIHKAEISENEKNHIKKIKNIENSHMRFKHLSDKNSIENIINQQDQIYNKYIIDNAKKDYEEEQYKIDILKNNEKEKLVEIYKQSEQKRKDNKKRNIIEKQKDIEMQKENIEIENKKYKQREEDLIARHNRIQQKMDKMAKSVIEEVNEKILVDENRLVKLQMEKDKKEMEIERDRKIKKYEQNKMINRDLLEQIDEKIKKKDHESLNDKKYRDELMERIKIENEQEQEKRQNYKNSLLIYKDYIKEQHKEKSNQIQYEMNENEENINRQYINKLEERN